MKRILGLLTALILGAGMLVGATSTAAQADGSFGTRWTCVNYRDIATCASLRWSRQADGSGVRYEQFQVWTSEGCGSLEDGGKYNPVEVWARYGADANYVDMFYDYGVEGCNFTKDVSNAVGNKGCVRIDTELKARIDGGLIPVADKFVEIDFRLCPDGSYTVPFKTVY